jgi:general secretion pathway protein G
MKPRASRLTPHASRPFGFTLIELLVVLAILATLLTLVVPRYYKHVERSREAVLRENLASTRDAIDQYHADAGVWPATLETLVERRYLRALPTDPITERSDTWQLVPPPDGASGIYDIRSGAEGSGLDGQAYSDW